MYNLRMEEYKRDAYVVKVPRKAYDELGCVLTHAVLVDIIESSGEITRKLLGLVPNEEMAKDFADAMNKWRDQTKFKQ